MKKRHRLILGAALLITAFFWSYRNSQKQREIVSKFNTGDCIHHKDMDEDAEFYIVGIEEERYKLVTFQGQQPAYQISPNPAYSLTSYMDQFYVKTQCPAEVFYKTLPIAKDPLYSIRILIMARDLKVK